MPSTEQMLAYAVSLDGQLTATIHGSEEEVNSNLKRARLLQRKVGLDCCLGINWGVR